MPSNSNTNFATEEKQLRICIMGGGGYLGQLLAKQLQSLGHFVVLLDLQFPFFPNIPIDQQQCLAITGSITDASHLRQALTGCDACFHLAGYGMSGSALLDREKCFAVNVEGTRRVLSECIRAGVSRLVFTSTVFVIFDGHTELDMADEESTPYVKEFGGNAYAESKCLAEQMVLAANNPPQMATCALRLRGIYGPGELRTVQRCAELCLRGIVKCTFGRTRNVPTQYSAAENIVQALILAERSLRIGKHSAAAGKAYHIVDGGPPMDSFGFWYPMIAAIGCPLPSFHIPYSLAYNLGILFELLYRLFGWEPLFTRYEVGLTGIPNTYSIARAQLDLGYAPDSSSNQLAHTTTFLQNQHKEAEQSATRPAKWLRKRQWHFVAFLVDSTENAIRSSTFSSALWHLLLLFTGVGFIMAFFLCVGF